MIALSSIANVRPAISGLSSVECRDLQHGLPLEFSLQHARAVIERDDLFYLGNDLRDDLTEQEASVQNRLHDIMECPEVVASCA